MRSIIDIFRLSRKGGPDATLSQANASVSMKPCFWKRISMYDNNTIARRPFYY